MKKLLFSIAFIFVLFAANAQYKHSLGVAFGRPSGLSYKTFISKDRALDFTLGGLGSYFSLSGMYEIHGKLENNLQYYYGPGAHIGSWNGHNYGNGVFAGIDGVIGIELDPNIPFAFSLDLRPGINVIGNNWDDEYHWIFWQTQFSIRYIF